MQSADWSDLAPRLLLGARQLWKRMGLGRYRSAPTPEDLVHDAIASVLDGRRSISGEVSLFDNLYWIMHSQAHAFKKRQRPLGESRGSRFVGLDGLPGGHVSEPPQRTEDEAFRRAVFGLVADDELMVEMVRVWLREGPLPARELAVVLEVPVETIYARTRKLKRRLRKSPLWES